MSISLKHAFTSGVVDDAASSAAGEVLPSHWNAEHTLTLSADRLLGRVSSAGAAQEISLGSGLAFSGTSLILDTDLSDLAALTPTDNNIIVGNGSNWVTESGDTARTSLGVGSGDSPQFTAINLNHATANTLTASGGHMSIEGATVWDSGNDGSGSGLDADLLDGKNIGTSGNVVPLLDGANTWSAAQTFTAPARLNKTINETYDLFTSTVATSLYISGTTASAVATGKSLHAISVRPSISSLVGTANFKGYDFDIEILASAANTDAYGMIGEVSNAGAGATKAIYGRASGEPGHTGILSGIICGVTTQSGSGTATGIEISNDTSAGGDIDYFIWHHANAGTVNAVRGLFFDSDCTFSQAAINVRLNASPGAGDFLRLESSTPTTLFNVTAAGAVATGSWTATKIGLAYGGTNADLSATGGSSQVLKQASAGAAITVGQLAASDLSNGTTGSGAVVLATSPSLTTPALGTPSSGTLTNCTGLPISTGVSGLAAGIATFLATPSSANLISAVTDETGSGALVFANTPTLVTPVIGAATGTSVILSSLGVFGHTAQLSIGGNSDNLENFGTTAATGGMALGMFNATAGTAAHLDFYRSKNAAIGSATVVASGDTLGQINFYGAQQTGTFATQSLAAQIQAFVDGTVTSGAGADMPGRLGFYTSADGSATPTERLRLTKEGYLRFGADPSSAYLVDGADAFVKVSITDTSPWNYVQAVFAANTAGPDIVFAKSRNATVGSHTVVQDGDAIGALWSYASDGTNFIAAAALRFFIDGTPGTNDMPGRIVLLTTADGAASPTERLRIDNQGNIIALSATATPPTLATNGQWVMTPTSNTNMRISYRGSDGTTRVGNITLA